MNVSWDICYAACSWEIQRQFPYQGGHLETTIDYGQQKHADVAAKHAEETLTPPQSGPNK
jgi:hypothetical protein